MEIDNTESTLQSTNGATSYAFSQNTSQKETPELAINLGSFKGILLPGVLKSKNEVCLIAQNIMAPYNRIFNNQLITFDKLAKKLNGQYSGLRKIESNLSKEEIHRNRKTAYVERFQAN